MADLVSWRLAVWYAVDVGRFVERADPQEGLFLIGNETGISQQVKHSKRRINFENKDEKFQ